MRRLLLLLGLLLPSACRPGPPVTPGPRTVAGVVLVRHSGPVAAPWSEQLDISTAAVRFQRTGEPGSPVNAGTWHVAFEPAAVSGLFERLGAVDCSILREIRPAEVPEGGGSDSYEVRYADGAVCSVWYRDGITYEGAEPLVAAIDLFIESLSLPAEARPQLRLTD